MNQKTISIDISKNAQTIYNGEQIQEIKNKDLIPFLKKEQPETAYLENTGEWTTRVTKALQKANCENIILIDTLKFKYYREQNTLFNKTDDIDAKLMYKYGQEYGGYRYRERSEFFKKLNDLIHQRNFISDIKTRAKIQERNFEEVPEHDKKVYQEYLQKEIKKCKEEIKKVDQEIKKIIKESEYKHLLNKFYGLILVAKLLNAMRDPKRFPTQRHFASYLGFRLKTYQSGTINKKQRMNKRGMPDVRKILYLSVLGQLSSKKETPIKKMYYRLKNEKHKNHYVVMVACMNKLARYFWTVATKKWFLYYRIYKKQNI